MDYLEAIFEFSKEDLIKFYQLDNVTLLSDVYTNFYVPSKLENTCIKLENGTVKRFDNMFCSQPIITRNKPQNSQRLDFFFLNKRILIELCKYKQYRLKKSPILVITSKNKLLFLRSDTLVYSLNFSDFPEYLIFDKIMNFYIRIYDTYIIYKDSRFNITLGTLNYNDIYFDLNYIKLNSDTYLSFNAYTLKEKQESNVITTIKIPDFVDIDKINEKIMLSYKSPDGLYYYI